MEKSRLESVLLGLAVGDSLGATSEFQIPWEVPDNCIFDGWPGRLIGQGKARWKRGEPTDDTEMSMAIIRSYVESDFSFNPDSIAKNFLEWMQTNPPDIGNTTRTTLQHYVQTPNSKFYAGGLHYHENISNKGEANGSLMRNGPIPALYIERSETEIIDYTVKQGIITHFHPAPVICCVIQSILIYNALKNQQNNSPSFEDIEKIVNQNWLNWLNETADQDCKDWIKKVGLGDIKVCSKKVLEQLKDFNSWDPYTHHYKGISGHCVLTLKIALWGLHWSFQEGHPTTPDYLPKWCFERHGFDVIMWIVLIGADADTYAASSGPLLAAYHPNINDDFLDGLMVKEEIQEISQKIFQHKDNV